MAEDIDRIRAALDYIPADDRDVWVHMGMAVKSVLGQGGFAIWDTWSPRAADKYDAQAAQAVWKSIDQNGGIGIGSLFNQAKQHGWKPERTAPRAAHGPIIVKEAARYTYTDA